MCIIGVISSAFDLVSTCEKARWLAISAGIIAAPSNVPFTIDPDQTQGLPWQNVHCAE